MNMDIAKHNERVETVAQRPWVKPRVDIFEGKDELVVITDLPGVAEKDLRIDLNEDQLTIEARREESHKALPVTREYHAFDYRRSFLLPTGIDRLKISAELKNGVLRLRLPKSEATRPRRIEVKAG